MGYETIAGEIYRVANSGSLASYLDIIYRTVGGVLDRIMNNTDAAIGVLSVLGGFCLLAWSKNNGSDHHEPDFTNED